MGNVNAPVVNLTGGTLGALLHARVDVQQYPTGNEISDNFWPVAQGPITRRPPLIHTYKATNSSIVYRPIPFVFSADQSYLVYAYDSVFRFFTDNGEITIPEVSTSISDGDFATASEDYVTAATITASSTHLGSTGNLKDFDAGTSWTSGSSGSAWLKFDLGAAKLVQAIVVTAATEYGQYAPTSWTLQASTTGAFAGEQVTKLTVSATAPYANQEQRRFTLSGSTQYRYWRMVMTANGNDGALEGYYADVEDPPGSGVFVSTWFPGPAALFRVADVQMTNLGAWFDASTAPSKVSIINGQLWLDSDGAAKAVARMPVTIGSGDAGKLHVVAFTVFHGPVNIRIGTTADDDDLLGVKGLGTGVHYLEWTPLSAGTVHLEFWHEARAGRAVDSVAILPGPSFAMPTPYDSGKLFDVHYAQQGDVLTMTHGDVWTRRLMRRGHRSWSLERLLPVDGPFGDLNATNITIRSDATSGEVVLTSSEPLFSDDDEDVLFSLTNQGQTKTKTASAADTYTDAIRVTGLNAASRTFTVTISGSFVGTVQLQASSGNENDYGAVSGHSAHTSATTFTYFDNLSNQTWYYRLAVTAYTSGSITMTLAYSGGSGTGIVRVMYVTSPTTAYGEVLSTLASVNATKTWKRGSWSDGSGHPVSVTRGYGRHWYGRGIKLWSTVSDDFTSFDAGDGKDDRAISVTIAAPSSDAIKWLSYLGNIIIGTSTAEYIGLPITNAQVVSPSNFQVVDKTYRGGTSMMPVNADGSVLFVDRTRSKLIQFVQNPKALSDTAYIAVDLNELSSELMWDGIRSIAIQRTPEPRIFCVLNSGICRVLLFRRDIGDLGVAAWATIKTHGGIIEHVTVLPETDGDTVYFMVKRTVGGSTMRSLERLGPSVVLNDEDLYHLDSALELNLSRPDTIATASSASGTITIKTEDSAFVSGDVGKVVWIGGGLAEITAFTSATQVTASVRFPITVVDEDGVPEPAASGRWGMGAEVSRVEGLSHMIGETVRIYGDMIDLGTAVVDVDGGVDLPRPCSVVKIGKDVVSRFKSLKLSYGAQKGTGLNQNKAVKNLSLVLYRTGPTLMFGHSFATKDLKPVHTRTTEVLAGQPTPLYTGEWFGGENGSFEMDARQHYEVRGPAPATLLAHVLDIDTRDR